MRDEALLVIDVQNDFCPGGALAVEHGDNVIQPINRLVKKANAAGMFIVASQDWHPEITTHFQKNGGMWPVHCVQNTHGAEFHPYLVLPFRNTFVVPKGISPNEGGFSAFENTSLNERLGMHSIRRIYAMGLAIDYCVKASVLDACHLGYEVYVVLDACRGVELNHGDSARAILEMSDADAKIVFSPDIEF